MRRITGTGIYGMFKCARMVALDFHGDRSLRRKVREEEEFMLRRGREHEARIVAELGWPEPEYAVGEFEDGAGKTLAMLRENTAGVSQGVLCDGDLLGIPDLLRREPGSSDLGECHYVVGDIKSSARMRSDQVLQVAFYSRMLAKLQGRLPDYGYLIFKDGREERFDLRDFDPVLDDLLARVIDLRNDPTVVRPFRRRACDGCRWSEVCDAELCTADDLSLVQGMTAGIRKTLEGAGLCTGAGLAKASVEPLARRTRLEITLLRRLKAAAQASQDAKPRLEARGKVEPMQGAAILHFLTDPYEDRVLFMGLLLETADGSEIHTQFPMAREQEYEAFEALILRVPKRVKLLHYGSVIPHWYEASAHSRRASVDLEKRLIDLSRQLRGAAVYPAPIFGFAEHVRFGLDLDPHRHGRSDAVALRCSDEGGRQWLLDKGRSDLEDLRALRSGFLRAASC